jgi:hypothetical protein
MKKDWMNKSKAIYSYSDNKYQMEFVPWDHEPTENERAEQERLFDEFIEQYRVLQ